MNASTLQNDLVTFDALPVGSRFRFPVCLGHLLIHKGTYFKTGPGWYGTRADERVFPWLDETPFVEAA